MFRLFTIIAVSGVLLVLYAFGGVTLVTMLVLLVVFLFCSILFLCFSEASEKEDNTSYPESVEMVTTTPSSYKIPFSSVFDHHIDPILLLSGSGRIERANRAARLLLGSTIKGNLLSSVLRQPEVLNAVDLAVREDQNGVVNFTLFTPHEAFIKAIILPVSIKNPSKPIKDTSRASMFSSPRSKLIMLVLRDETILRRSDRMRADFLANASHELRTPLASLTGFIETLKGHAREDIEAQNQFLDIMSLQADRMRRLIDDLLSLSRIELNEHIVPTGHINLVHVVNEIKDALKPLLADRNQTLEIQTQGKEHWVCGDYDQLVEVVQNLVENALKYSNSGGKVRVLIEGGHSLGALMLGGTDLYRQGTLRDQAAESPPAQDIPGRLYRDSAHINLLLPPQPSVSGPEGKQREYIVLTVRDWGSGIARHHLPRLAERFYRVEGQDQKIHSGTGLGLAIVKHIISRHRGGLVVESAIEKGSAFSVSLPGVVPEESESLARKQEETPKDKP